MGVLGREWLHKNGGKSMTDANTIELHANMWLRNTFIQRGWANPHCFAVATEMSGIELLAELNLSAKEVEVIFVNHRAYSPWRAVICPGDRVALFSPGAVIFPITGAYDRAFGIAS